MYVCMFFVCIYDCPAKECAKTATSKSRGGPDGLGELASSASDSSSNLSSSASTVSSGLSLNDEKILRVVEQCTKLKEALQRVATPQKKIPKFDPEPVEEKNMDMNMPALTGRVGEILGVLQHKVKPGQDQTSEPAVQPTTPQNEHILPEHVTCSKAMSYFVYLVFFGVGLQLK